MPTPPSFRKVNPADQPIFYLVLRSATLPLSVVNEYAETAARAAPVHHQRRRAGAGVRLAEVRGARAGRPEQARVDGHRLRRGAEGDRRTPTSTSRPARSTARASRSRCAPTASSRPPAPTSRSRSSTAMAHRCGWRTSPIWSTASRTTRSASWFNGERAIVLAIQRQPGTNTVETVQSIRKILPSFQAAPAGVGEVRRALRPLDFHPRVGRRREVHAGAGRRCWWCW